MSFFKFSQNNSGGSFEFNEVAGITRFVVVEADTAEEANNKALSIGIYFDGCNAGIDCKCCGDRWNPVSQNSASERADSETYILISKYSYREMGENPEGFIHYKNGKIEAVYCPKN